MSDDRAVPVSSNFTHARTAAITSAAAAKQHTADVQRAYKHLGLKDISRISVLPFPSSINPSDAMQQLPRSVKASTSDIRMMCNDDIHEGLSSTDWIRGWEYPLKKSFAHAIAPDKPTTAPLTTLMDDCFGQVSRALAAGSTGPDAFTILLRLLSNHFDRTDTGASYIKLHNFGVPNGTSVCDFSRAFRGGVSAAMGTERNLAPGVEVGLVVVWVAVK